MKKINCLLFFALMFMGSVKAQEAAKSVFFELGGPGLASVNYDMRFNKTQDGLGFRVGVGGFSVRSDFSDGSRDRTSLITVPVGINYLIGKDTKHYFEVGAGATYINAKYTSDFEDDNDAFRESFGHLTFGYRLQPQTKGFTFRAAITPVFGKGFFIPYYAGISFGYKF